MNFADWSEEIMKSWTKAQQDYWQSVQGMDNSGDNPYDTWMKTFSVQGLASVQALKDRTEQMTKEDFNAHSLRELYELWINVGEEVYQQFAMSEQYKDTYGKMTNAFVDLKSNLDELRDTQLQALNIPTHHDINIITEKLQSSERENAALRDQLEALAERLKVLESTEAHNEQTESLKLIEERLRALEIAQAEAMHPTPQQQQAVEFSTPDSASDKDHQEQQSNDAPAASTPAAAPVPAKNTAPDDLTRIKGLGPKMSDKLIDAGIQTFDQLAALSGDEAEQLDRKLSTRGRLIREKWVAQAVKLSNSRMV